MTDTWETIPTYEANEGDTVRITYTLRGDTYTTTGPLTDTRYGLFVGHASIRRANGGTVERLIPDWTTAQLVEVDGNRYANDSSGDQFCWFKLGTNWGETQWHDDATLAALGTPHIVIDAEGTLL